MYMEKGRSAFKILTSKPTEKRPIGRSRRRWEDNIRIDFKEIAINTRNWVDSAQDGDYWEALLNTALKLRVPQAMELVKPTGKRHLGRPRRRWEDNIRMGFEEMGINAGNWVDSAQDGDYWRALVNAELNFCIT